MLQRAVQSAGLSDRLSVIAGWTGTAVSGMLHLLETLTGQVARKLLCWVSLQAQLPCLMLHRGHSP